ncbi:hypothetical protein N7540_002962 [Penicillium herquei]|nr:hypothetical protein N7540_002962 [Penicillium herquei]
MPDPLSITTSALTLAGLFKLCIQAFEFVQIAKNQAVDVEKLTLKFTIEKCRLLTWGQQIGLSSLSPDASSPLDESQFRDVIQKTLRFILGLLDNAEALRKKYGCHEVQSSENELLPSLVGREKQGPIDWLSLSFKDIKVHNESRSEQARVVKRGLWVIYDRKKFTALVSEIKEFIDGLLNITKDLASLESQDRAIRSRITTINDEDTLDMVADVCKIDYPSFSDAASVRAEAITLSTNLKDIIHHWVDDVEDDDSYDTETLNEIESSTTTELKHKVLRLQQYMKESRQISEILADVTIKEDAKLLDSTAQNDKQQQHFPVEDVRRLVANDTELRNTLNVYVGKFRENITKVEETLQNSNELFLTFRKEMDEMAKKTKRLQKENEELTNRHNQTSRKILQMAEERSKNEEELEKWRKQSQIFQDLCRRMQSQSRVQNLTADLIPDED